MNRGPTWLLVARLMASDARRSRGLLVAAVLFGTVAAAAAILPAAVLGDALTARRAVTFLVAPMKVLVSLVALLAGYGAIAGARSGGQLILLLSLPVERRALVVGAFAGRVAVVVAGVTVGLAAVATVLFGMYGHVPVRALSTLGGLLVLLAVALTALAVGLSAATRTRARAAVAVVGAFVLFEFFWGVVPAGVHYLLEGSLPGAVVPGWVVLIERLQPVSAFETTATAVLPAVDGGVQLSPGGAAPAETTGAPSLGERVAGPVPAYLTPEAGVATLIGWTVAALTAGAARFERADL